MSFDRCAAAIVRTTVTADGSATGRARHRVFLAEALVPTGEGDYASAYVGEVVHEAMRRYLGKRREASS